MTITDSGTVGIGTDSCYYSGTKLAVANDSGDAYITIGSSSTGIGGIYFSDATSGVGSYYTQITYDHDDEVMKFVAGGSARIVIECGGNVGIGTAAPEGIFQTYYTAQSTWRIFTSAETDAEILFGVDVDGTAKYARIGVDFSAAKAFKINASDSVGLS